MNLASGSFRRVARMAAFPELVFRTVGEVLPEVWRVMEADLRLDVELRRKLGVAGAVAAFEHAELAEIVNHLSPMIRSNAGEPAVPRGSGIERFLTHFPRQLAVHHYLKVLLAQHVVRHSSRPERRKVWVVLLVVTRAAARAVGVPWHRHPARQIAGTMGAQRPMLADRDHGRQSLAVVGFGLPVRPWTDAEGRSINRDVPHRPGHLAARMKGATKTEPERGTIEVRRALGQGNTVETAGIGVQTLPVLQEVSDRPVREELILRCREREVVARAVGHADGVAVHLRPLTRIGRGGRGIAKQVEHLAPEWLINVGRGA